jgi:anti-anti-sigma regulatory factor
MTVASFVFDLELVGEVSVIRFVVDCIDSDNLDMVADELLEFITPDSPAKLVVDLSRVVSIDHVGLETLAIFHDSVVADGSDIRFCCLRPEFKTALQNSDRRPDIDFRDSLAEALVAF